MTIKTEKTEQDNQPTGVMVKFLTNHEHAGREYRFGTTLEVSPMIANYLINQNIAEKFVE